MLLLRDNMKLGCRCFYDGDVHVLRTQEAAYYVGDAWRHIEKLCALPHSRKQMQLIYWVAMLAHDILMLGKSVHRMHAVTAH